MHVLQEIKDVCTEKGYTYKEDNNGVIMLRKWGYVGYAKKDGFDPQTELQLYTFANFVYAPLKRDCMDYFNLSEQDYANS